MKKRRIGSILLISCILFGYLVSSIVGAIGYFYYDTAMMKKNKQYAESILNYVTDGIDVDKLNDAINSSKRNDEIDRIEKICDKVKNTHNIKYLYIVKPLNLNDVNNMQYVLTGESIDDRKNDFHIEIGKLTEDEYSKDIVKNYFDNMNSKGELTFFTNTTEFGYMYTGMKTIIDSNGNSICVAACDLDMNDIVAAKNSYIFMIAISAILITLLFIIVLFIWLSRRIIKPINNIEKAANSFVKLSHNNNVGIDDLLYEKPNINTKDEIESLSNSISTMANDLKSFMKSIMKVEGEKNRIEAELNIAKNIQASMLPNANEIPYNDKRFDIYAYMTPAKEVGGDFYDFFKIDDDNLAIVVADVSGKGVPAALFMAIGKTLIKDHSLKGKNLGEVFSEVNNLLCEANSEELFITAFEAVINLKIGHVIYVNAGHEMPYIYRKGSEYSALKIAPGFVLAGMEGMKYTAGDFDIKPGDKIFEYTDGVTEATDKNNELYGMDRLKCILDKTISRSPKDCIFDVKDDIDKFVGDAPQFDDITMLCVELKEG